MADRPLSAGEIWKVLRGILRELQIQYSDPSTHQIGYTPGDEESPEKSYATDGVVVGFYATRPEYFSARETINKHGLWVSLIRFEELKLSDKFYYVVFIHQFSRKR